MTELEKLAATAASLAETAEKLAATFACADHWFNVVVLAHREGYEQGLAERGPRPRGSRSSATLHALPGGDVS